MAGRGSRFHYRLNRRRWARVRVQIFKRDGYRCRSCHLPGRLECDHRIPLWLDRDLDPYDPANLQTLCRTCHIEKTAGENRKPDPARDAWRAMVAELAGE